MIGFPKPERRRVAKKRAQRQKGLTRSQARAFVYRRERWRCERCKRLLTLDVYPPNPAFPHVNEKVPRSRGGDPCDVENLELLCGPCHMPHGQHAPTAERMRKLQRKGRAA